MEAREAPQEGQVQALMAAVPVPTLLVRKEPDGLLVVGFNDAAVRLTQGGVAGIVGMRADEAYAHEPQLVADLERALADHLPVVRESVLKLASTGHEHLMRTHAVPVGTQLVMLQAEDLAAERRAQDLAASMIATERAFEDAPIGMGIVRLDGSYARVNDAFVAMVGRSREEIQAAPWPDLVHPDDRRTAERALNTVREGGNPPPRLELCLVRSDGTMLDVVKTMSLARDESMEEPYLVCQYVDVSERRRYESELVRRALHDPLTGLPNRALFDDRVHHALGRRERTGEAVGVLFLDLDDFKRVNDSLGHGAGDQVLVETARRLESAMRTGDTICRFGGDEFIVLCEDLTRDAREAQGAALEVSERLLARIADAPYAVDGAEVHLRGSVGIAIACPGGSTSAERLVSEADAAMYRAKGYGGGRSELARDETSHAVQRLGMENDLRQALRATDGLWLAYQPIVDLVSGQLAGLEALLRWERPGHGPVSPAEVIPLAEESGLIGELGTWVMERAIRDIASWKGVDSPFVAINLGAAQFGDPDLVGALQRCLDEHAVEARRISLEITESVAMGDAKRALATMDDLKSVGVRIAIDDFGTGFSSLGYLKRFPADTVKIDREFIGSVATPSGDRAIVEAVLSMAGALDLDVVAEGVETEQQRAALADLGCRRAQGFLFARPERLDVAAALTG